MFKREVYVGFLLITGIGQGLVKFLEKNHLENESKIKSGSTPIGGRTDGCR